MNDSLNRLYTSPDRPLDPLTLAVLRVIDVFLREAGIPYMLVGATARDLLLFHVYGQAIRRATYDLDFAIVVDSWEQFAAVKQLLVGTPGFVDEHREAQRLHYTPPGSGVSIVVDIIPFGRLATAEQKIEWPPDADVVMNVAAFSDALASCVEIQVDATLIIPVVSLPGLIILKLFAWLDRRDDRDVIDIQRLMETYADTGNTDRLYEQESEELERVDFDLTLAGAYLLGRDSYMVTNKQTHAQLIAALTPVQVESLIQKMARAKMVFDDHTEYVVALLNGFLRGLRLAPE